MNYLSLKFTKSAFGAISLLALIAPAISQTQPDCSSFVTCDTQVTAQWSYDYVGFTSASNPNNKGLKDTVAGGIIPCQPNGSCISSNTRFIASGDTFDFDGQLKLTPPNAPTPQTSVGFTEMLVYYLDPTRGAITTPTTLMSAASNASGHGEDWAILYTPGDQGLSIQQLYPYTGLFYPTTYPAFTQGLWDPDFTSTGYTGYAVLFVTVGPDQKTTIDTFLFTLHNARNFTWLETVTLGGFPSTYYPSREVKIPDQIFAPHLGTATGLQSAKYTSESEGFPTQPGLSELAYANNPLSQKEILAAFEDRASRVYESYISTSDADFVTAGGSSVLLPCNTGQFLTGSLPATIVTPCANIQAFDPAYSAQ